MKGSFFLFFIDGGRWATTSHSEAPLKVFFYNFMQSIQISFFSFLSVPFFQINIRAPRAVLHDVCINDDSNARYDDYSDRRLRDRWHMEVKMGTMDDSDQTQNKENISFYFFSSRGKADRGRSSCGPEK